MAGAKAAIDAEWAAAFLYDGSARCDEATLASTTGVGQRRRLLHVAVHDLSLVEKDMSRSRLAHDALDRPGQDDTTGG